MGISSSLNLRSFKALIFDRLLALGTLGWVYSLLLGHLAGLRPTPCSAVLRISSRVDHHPHLQKRNRRLCDELSGSYANNVTTQRTHKTGSGVDFFGVSPQSSLDGLFRHMVASGHTATNTPDLFRTPKLTVAGPGQYWGGGPPGKPFGCC